MHMPYMRLQMQLQRLQYTGGTLAFNAVTGGLAAHKSSCVGAQIVIAIAQNSWMTRHTHL